MSDFDLFNTFLSSTSGIVVDELNLGGGGGGAIVLAGELNFGGGGGSGPIVPLGGGGGIPLDDG